VSQAIEAIESQTGFQISYNKNQLDTSRSLVLKSATVPMDELLQSIADGAGVRAMVQGNYIAFVPDNDNSRPQVKQQTPAPARTQDRYNPNDPRNLSASPQPRPVVESAPAAAQPAVPATAEPAKPFYSDFRSLDSYNVIQNGRPRFAVKTNLLYGAAALTPNLAVEFALASRSTVVLSYSNNPWNHKAKMPSNRKLLHGIVSAGYRYWLCERFDGHFFGVNALYSEYNVSGIDIPTLFEKEYRYHGNAYGGGINYGYALPVGKRWNVEFTAGVGVLIMKYDKYSCLTCDTNAVPATKTWFGPTNLGINLVFLIK
jgi:hypothetical protein